MLVKKNVFNFEIAQVRSIWNNVRQFQSRQKVQIFAVIHFLWYKWNRIAR